MGSFPMLCSGFARAMLAAIDSFVGLDAVSQHPAATMFARRCHHVDGTFEAVESALFGRPS